ncbi:MAG: hypothetical protein VB018_06390 [Lachnospiraceae bacterium]|nr:hypothetical protein [Lachnospiraceae bacterium]
MGEKDRIYELTKQLKNINPIDEDVYNAIDLLKNNFHKNYVRKLYLAAEGEEDKVKKKPPREVVLLRALKGFSSPTALPQIDNAIEMLTLLRAAENIQDSIGKISNPKKEIEMQSNGEKVNAEQPAEIIDPASAKLTGVLMTLALLGKL